MSTIIKTGGGVPVQDYEALQAQLNSLQSQYNSLNSEYSNYKSTHSSIHIYKIGSSNSDDNRTFNVSSYANYQKFTSANFYIRATGIGFRDASGAANWRDIIASYNASTGVLTCNAIYEYEGYHGRHYYLNYDVYLIDTGDITIA